MENVETVQDDVQIETVDNIFDGNDGKSEVEAQPTKEDEPEVVEGDTSEDNDAETPAADENKTIPLHQFKAALKSAEEKTLAAEKRAKDLETKISEQVAQKTPDRDEDPDGYERHLRMNLSKEMMAESHKDYFEMANKFLELAADNPVLAKEAENHPLPAKFAYEKAKEHIEMMELKDLKSSDDFQLFLKWKKEQEDKPEEKPEMTEQQKKNLAALGTPKLNKATSGKVNSSKVEKIDNVDELFD